MILTCPACATRYRVADQEFEGSGERTVRCANCGYVWRETARGQQPPEIVAPPVAAAGTTPATSPYSPSGTEAASTPRLEIPPNSRPAPARTRSFASRGAVAAGLILAAVIAGVLIHGHFTPAGAPAQTAAAPPASGQPASGVPMAAGLIIRNITPARTADGLVVDGEIANPGNVPRDVPRLRVALQDSAEREVQVETVDPPKARLEPGEVAHFETPFAHPPDAATGVVVTFASS